jgi:CRP-like cAMP-binding protein
VVEGLRAEARYSAAVLAAAGDLAGEERRPQGTTAFLQGALLGEADRARARALLWLALAHDPKVVARVREAVRHEAREKRALAVELLDVTLEGEERGLALAISADAGPRGDALRALFPQDPRPEEERLRDLVGGEGWPDVLRAAAIYRVAERGKIALRPALEEALADHEPTALLAETAAFTRSVLAGEATLDRKGRRMLTIEKVLTLKAARMFQEASEDVLSEVAAILEEVEIGLGEVVFAKGEAGDSMYIIADGRMRVSDGERTVDELGEGEVFGELALLDPEPRLFTVAALEDGRLLRLDREAFLELMAGDIEIVRGVLHVLCERLRQAEASAAAERS